MPTICPKCGYTFKDPGRSKGGKLGGGKRIITTREARRMVRIREAKRKAKKVLTTQLAVI